MSSLLVILIGTVLTNTFLLMHNDEALGGDRHSGGVASAIRIGGATFVTLLLSVMFTLLVWRLFNHAPVDSLLLAYSGAVVIIAIGLHRVTRNRLPRLRRSLASSPILVVGNCLALGTVLLPTMSQSHPFTVLLTTLALGAAFVLVFALFTAQTARITDREVPIYFRLAPITLISAGLTALALMGFTGILRG